MTTYQADGLMANGTKRTQNGGVRSVFANTCKDLWRVFGKRFALTVFGRDAVETGRQATE